MNNYKEEKKTSEHNHYRKNNNKTHKTIIELRSHHFTFRRFCDRLNAKWDGARAGTFNWKWTREFNNNNNGRNREIWWMEMGELSSNKNELIISDKIAINFYLKIHRYIWIWLYCDICMHNTSCSLVVYFGSVGLSLARLGVAGVIRIVFSLPFSKHAKKIQSH